MNGARLVIGLLLAAALTVVAALAIYDAIVATSGLALLGLILGAVLEVAAFVSFLVSIQTADSVEDLNRANLAQALSAILVIAALALSVPGTGLVFFEVTTHTDPISVPGWQGAGYVILDPETGAGAWKIGGGQNGGGIWLLLGFLLLAAIVIGPAIAFVSTVAFIFGGGLNAVAITLSLWAAGALHVAADDIKDGDWEAIFRQWSAFELRVASALSRIVRIIVFVFKQLSTEQVEQ